MPTFGRRPIFTAYAEINDGNIKDVLAKAMGDFKRNQAEIRHLFDVYRGNQPILQRIKEVRPNINNKCVLNHANEIVSFKVSYLLSEPIMYVKRGARKATKAISKLSDYMHLEAKSAKDKEIADDFNICGVAYRLVLPNSNPNYADADESPFNVYTLNPEQTFVVRYTGVGAPVVCGVFMIIRKDEATGIDHEIANVYTDKTFYEIDLSGGENGMTIRKRSDHMLGRVPIIEYINNNSRIGSFEIVETLLDTMNTLQSNRIDGTEQTVQSLMVFKNCEYDGEDDLDAIKDNGAVMIKSGQGVDSDLKLLSPELNQGDQQVLMDNLYKEVLTITGMPAMASENTSDSSNNGAAFMRGGWYSADARAKDSELLWKRSETEFLRVVLGICRNMGVLNLSISEIDMKFTRRNYEDILSKSQTLTNMLSSGIDPLHAIAQCGLFGDPTEVYEASLPYLKKWEYEDTTDDNSENPEDNGEQTTVDLKKDEVKDDA